MCFRETHRGFQRIHEWVKGRLDEIKEIKCLQVIYGMIFIERLEKLNEVETELYNTEEEILDNYLET